MEIKSAGAKRLLSLSLSGAILFQAFLPALAIESSQPFHDAPKIVDISSLGVSPAIGFNAAPSPLPASITDEDAGTLEQLQKKVTTGLIQEGFPQRAVNKHFTRFSRSTLSRIPLALSGNEDYAKGVLDAVRLRLVRSRLRKDLSKEGRSLQRIRSWMKHSQIDLRGLSLEEAKAAANQELDAIDQIVATAKNLRRQKDYEGVLRYANQVSETSPQLADYATPWANNAFKKHVYIEANYGRNSLRARALEYIRARNQGRVQTYYPTANASGRQCGPSCAIHALYNIAASITNKHTLKIPEYPDFEKAVQNLIRPNRKGLLVGTGGRGISGNELAGAAQAAGLQITDLAQPQTQEEFDALLESRQGAAYVSLLTNAARRGKSPMGHSIFIGEKWTGADGKTYYSVADSNGGPLDLAFYTWDQIGPRIKLVVLFYPDDPAEFPQKLYDFTQSRAPPLPNSLESEPQDNGLDWNRVTQDLDFALKAFEKWSASFPSFREFQRYAANMAERQNQ